jgi:hypothetical protein
MEAREAGPFVDSKKICQSQDLACGRSAILLWYLPVFALFIGLGWTEARPWLWIPAFLVMGIACLANAARCGRLHCFVTGPIYLSSAVYVALASFGLVPLRPGIFMLIVLGITTLACVAERPLGTYKNKA